MGGGKKIKRILPPRTLFIGAVSSVVEALDFFALEAED